MMWHRLPVARAAQGFAHDYLGLWNWDGTLDRALSAARKPRAKPAPRRHRQSVKSAEKGGLASSHGFDAGKLIKGKKRHVLVDTQGC